MPQDVLSKSWLFEVVNKKTNTIQDSFTLVLPPQSYTIKEKQRVKITKTFGNAFVDDYGPDNLEITIKAISGTARVFPTFITKGSTLTTGLSSLKASAGTQMAAKATVGYSQRDAFYVFRNNIMRYKDKFPDNFENYELRVYDLSDMQGYKCVLLEFSLDRTAEKPLRYPFSISLFVYQRMNGRADISSQVINIAKDPTTALDSLDALLDRAESAYSQIDTIRNGIIQAKQASSRMRVRLNSFYTRTGNVLLSPLTMAKDLLSATESVLGTVGDVYTVGKLSYSQYAGALEMFQNMYRGAGDIFGFAVTEAAVVEATVEEDNGITLTPPAWEDVEPSTVTPSDPGTWPVSKQASMAVSGVREYAVVGGDTLQRIALRELGDSSLWTYIAVVNSITGNDEIATGDNIFIPVLDAYAGTGAKDAFIMSEDAYRNPYGSDIRLDSDGEIVVGEGSDLRLVQGIDNIIQSVNLRLSTPIGSMIKQTAFGLSTQVGRAGGDIATSYLRMSLEASLLQDPRILSVPSMEFSVGGSGIQVKLLIELVGYSQTLPVSVTL